MSEIFVFKVILTDNWWFWGFQVGPIDETPPCTINLCLFQRKMKNCNLFRFIVAISSSTANDTILVHHSDNHLMKIGKMLTKINKIKRWGNLQKFRSAANLKVSNPLLQPHLKHILILAWDYNNIIWSFKHRSDPQLIMLHQPCILCRLHNYH